MPTTSLLANGDGTTSGTIGGTAGPPYYVNVDEGTDSPNDGDGITFASSGAFIFLLLTDLASDAVTVTGITAKLRTTNSSKGRGVSSFQFFQSDESTALTGSTTVTGSTTTTTYSFSPSITGATTKAAWDGARIKVIATGASGICSMEAIQVDVTYSTSDGSSTTQTAFLVGF